MSTNYKKSFLPVSMLVLFLSFFIANVSYSQWVDRSIPGTNEGDNIYTLHLEGDSLYAGTCGSGLFLSTDYGLNWTPKNAGLGINDLFIREIFRLGSDLFLGTEGSGVFKSSDNGENWTASGSGLPSGAEVVRLAALDNNIFAACKGGGLFLSTDNGTTWTQLTNGLVAGEDDFRAVVVLNNMVFAGNDDVGFFKSVDSGASWTQINSGLTGKYLRCKGAMFPYGANFYAGTKDGVIVTSDYENWTILGTAGLEDDDIRALFITAEYIFVGTDEKGLFYSVDGGENWTAHPGCGLEVRSILQTGAGLIVGCEDGKVFIDPSILSGIDEQFDIKPNHCTLSQNYPNPFNPSTTIQFNLMISGHVTLRIYNVLGGLVASLVDRQMQSGSHSIKWLADGMPTGVYYYKIMVNDFVEVRKMVYMK